LSNLDKNSHKFVSWIKICAAILLIINDQIHVKWSSEKAL